MTDTPVTSPAPSACPECAGPWRPYSHRGALTFRHRRNCPIDAAEITTECADHARRGDDIFTGTNRFTRPITPTEALLLTHLGYPLPPTRPATRHRTEQVASTAVRWFAGIRFRSWPTMPEPPPHLPDPREFGVPRPATQPPPTMPDAEGVGGDTEPAAERHPG